MPYSSRKQHILAPTKAHQTPQGVFGWLAAGAATQTPPQRIKGKDTLNSNPDLDSKTVSYSNRTRNPADSGDGHPLRRQGQPMVHGRAYARPHAHHGARYPKDGSRRCSWLDVRDYGWNLRVIAEPIVRRHPTPITPTFRTAFSIELDVRDYRLVIVEPIDRCLPARLAGCRDRVQGPRLPCALTAIVDAFARRVPYRVHLRPHGRGSKRGRIRSQRVGEPWEVTRLPMRFRLHPIGIPELPRQFPAASNRPPFHSKERRIPPDILIL